jgi:hypothetical protein
VNAGHRRGAVAYRCVGEGAKMVVKEFPAFAPVALAGIGDLPDTILDRAVVIRMKRRAPYEVISPFRHRQAAKAGEALRKRLEDWAGANEEALTAAEPTMPEGITDRPADVWEPLLAIADVAGGHWPARARAAAIELNAERSAADPSLGVRLLGDIRSIFATLDVDRLSTDDMLKKLCELDEAPWGDLRGKALDARGLASRLRHFGVRPDSIRLSVGTKKGYLREWFYDAWSRYLPHSGGSGTGGTPEQPQVTALADVPPGAAVPDANGTGRVTGTVLDSLTSTVTPVPDVAHFEQGQAL